MEKQKIKNFKEFSHKLQDMSTKSCRLETAQKIDKKKRFFYENIIQVKNQKVGYLIQKDENDIINYQVNNISNNFESS